jgi:4-hydroxybenzoate polyprenyltransferase
MNQRPLCVDLDGTLIKTDILHESILKLIKYHFFQLFMLPIWLFKGKSNLKSRIAERTTILYATLPYRPEILEIIKEARRDGRKIVLATASMRSHAEGVSAHLGVFDHIEASDEQTNLGGAEKARRLVRLFGEKGFDYVGNGTTDLAVWKHAHSAIVVAHGDSLVSRAQAVCGHVSQVNVEKISARKFLKSIRIHQWLKNVLVFLPLLAAHKTNDIQNIFQVLLAFLSFGLGASAVYVLNDLLDLDSDRQHKSKYKRPFASGLMGAFEGFMIIFVLLAGSGLVAWQLPAQFGAVLIVYFILTSLYSFWLKRQVVVDITMLATLYTVRIVAGAAAAQVYPSFWLLAFSMFFFLGLGTVKRYTELRDISHTTNSRPAGRGYTVLDLPLILNMGLCSSMVSTLVFALYIHSPETIEVYHNNKYLWPAAVALLYWNARVWMKAHREEIHEDPVVFATMDKQSWMIMLLVMACFYAANM